MEEEIGALQHKLYQQSQSSPSPGQVNVTSSHSSSNQPSFPSPFLDSTLGSNTQQNADSSSLTGLSDKLKRLVIDQSLQRHFGTSSSLTLVKTAMDINDIQISLDIQCPSSNSAHSLHSRRPEFWAIHPVRLPFPPRLSARQLITILISGKFLPMKASTLNPSSSPTETLSPNLLISISYATISFYPFSTVRPLNDPSRRGCIIEIVNSVTLSSPYARWVHGTLMIREFLQTSLHRSLVQVGSGSDK